MQHSTQYRSEFGAHTHKQTHTHTHLELLEFLQDHVVWHVVKEAVCGREDDVTQLDVEGRAVCSLRTVEKTQSRQATTLALN